jgi:hypothetical protein
MPLRLRNAWVGSVLGLTLCWAGAASAQNDAALRATARQLGSEGVQQFEAGNFAAASERLERAYQMLRVPSIGLWSARALVKLGKLIEANERYVEVQRLSLSGDVAVQRQAQADAQADAKQLEARIPSLTITVAGGAGADLSVTVDGNAVPNAVLGARWLVNPGEHAVSARQGSKEAMARVTVAEGEHKPVGLQLNEGATAPGAATAPAGAAPLPPPPANPGAPSQVAPAPGPSPEVPRSTAVVDTRLAKHPQASDRPRFGPYVGIGYVSIKADPSPKATTGYELNIGGGLSVPVASQLHVNGRLWLAYDKLTNDGGYEETDIGVALDGTLRWLPTGETPRFYLGLGPQVAYGTFEGSVAGFTSEGKWMSLAGLIEAGVLLGPDNALDLGVRAARGFSQCLEDECTDSTSLTLVTLGAGWLF